MVETRDAAAATVTAERCGQCGSESVAAAEHDWFVVDLDRADELREVSVEFRCRDCGTRWG